MLFTKKKNHHLWADHLIIKILWRQEKQGQGIGEDEETVQFRSYLMSLGIADPVTRDTHGSGQSYYKQLAKEVYQILERPLEVIMNLKQQVFKSPQPVTF